ncbi:MAG: nucleotide pyrophosphohydrolase [Oscillospiraceae bacterium]|jgi:NTP pyrophosphatase (non-canonical NTP hydrolase)|nr:nucleotide pyrophosphohydrolase [Oscillospiraceae bacterium]
MERMERVEHSGLTIDEMRSLQLRLNAKHPEWEKLRPEYGRSCLLWMMEEFGEVVRVLKRNDDEQVMDDPAVRSGFIEEMCDTLMFFVDTLICYDVSPEEFAAAYRAKAAGNLKRVWQSA